jgi:hypothetical protein
VRQITFLQKLVADVYRPRAGADPGNHLVSVPAEGHRESGPSRMSRPVGLILPLENREAYNVF